eukprot:TRINITY_DN2626_c0_g1_i1.p2 TRINITY_DN2626_c0_g1~~TRINITY_DN2626_c0_g1_i1.p2  ORF type:complete len:125 (-),score=31.16 TRINITY_DN2626_c0_g1_i1:488-862(-)
MPSHSLQVIPRHATASFHYLPRHPSTICHVILPLSATSSFHYLPRHPFTILYVSGTCNQGIVTSGGEKQEDVATKKRDDVEAKNRDDVSARKRDDVAARKTDDMAAKKRVVVVVFLALATPAGW